MKKVESDQDVKSTANEWAAWRQRIDDAINAFPAEHVDWVRNYLGLLSPHGVGPYLSLLEEAQKKEVLEEARELLDKHFTDDLVYEPPETRGALASLDQDLRFRNIEQQLGISLQRSK